MSEDTKVKTISEEATATAPVAPMVMSLCQKLAIMPDVEILAIIPMEGAFSQWEQEFFCGGVRRCAQYIIST